MYINLILYLFSFLTPSIKLESGKNIYIKGTGPPLLFSTGLFGSMPNFIYNNIQKKLSKNNSLILTEDYKPLLFSDIKEIVDALEVDYISLFAHSSIDPKIIESKYLNKIILCDPITVPDINIDGLTNKKIYPTGKVLIIKAEKLYNSDLTLPNYQNPIIKNNNIHAEITYKNVGHPDILDNIWSDLAINTNLWRGIIPEKKIVKFNEWKFKKKTNNKKKVLILRDKYKNFIINQTHSFLFNY